MRYCAYAGKVGQITIPIDAMSDRDALEQSAEHAGVRVVTRIEENGKEVVIFEDWEHLLGKEHPIFLQFSE